MQVTINTDASFKQGYGGYAFWIVCDAGKIQKAGKIKEPCLGSSDAEAMCITNAIYTLKHSRFTEITKVIINTDSEPSIHLLSGTIKAGVKTAISKVIEECKLLMMEICLANGLSIRDYKTVFELRHVKAHSGKKDSRSFVNEWCDQEAKRYCRLRVAEVKNKKL